MRGDGTWQDIGKWITPAFNAGDFTASGAMTWTLQAGDVEDYSYTLIGSKTMIISFRLSATSVGGTANLSLRIAIPAGKLAARKMLNSCIAVDGGGGVVLAHVQAATVGDAFIGIFLASGANWTLSTNATAVYGQITIEIQ